MFVALLWLAGGLGLLILGGELLVRGAVSIAKKMQVSTLVIGMTVVSFGTSAPELLVSLQAATGTPPHAAIAVGNVVGSNIANLALVLAITILIFPIVVDRNTKRLDWPVMMAASLLLLGMMWDGTLSRIDGIVLFVWVVVFTIYLIVSSRKAIQKQTGTMVTETETTVRHSKAIWITLAFLALGATGLFFGADWFLKGAVDIAKITGMDDAIIGVTVVAFGTSVPELVASAVAAFRKETNISVGNLIGSNLFNICTVLGLTAAIQPIDIATDAPQILTNDIWWMIAISAAVFPLMLIGKKLGRWKGVFLISSYTVYICLTVADLG